MDGQSLIGERPPWIRPMPGAGAVDENDSGFEIRLGVRETGDGRLGSISGREPVPLDADGVDGECLQHHQLPRIDPGIASHLLEKTQRIEARILAACRPGYGFEIETTSPGDDVDEIARLAASGQCQGLIAGEIHIMEAPAQDIVGNGWVEAPCRIDGPLRRLKCYRTVAVASPILLPV